MSETFQKDQNKDLFVTGKSSHSGSEPEDSVIIKARFYTLREGYGYFGKVRKLQQPQTNTFRIIHAVKELVRNQKLKSRSRLYCIDIKGDDRIKT